MENGTVTRVVVGKGFGFIGAKGLPDCFFHQSALDGGLTFDEKLEGRRVEFSWVEGQRGPKATRVWAAED